MDELYHDGLQKEGENLNCDSSFREKADHYLSKFKDLYNDLRKGNMSQKDIRRNIKRAELGDMFQILTLQIAEEFIKERALVKEYVEEYQMKNNGKPVTNIPFRRYITKRKIKNDEFREYEELRDFSKNTVKVIRRRIYYDLNGFDGNFIDSESGMAYPFFWNKAILREFIMSSSKKGWMTNLMTKNGEKKRVRCKRW